MSKAQAKFSKSLFVVLLIWSAIFLTALNLVRAFGTKTLPQADELWALYDARPGIDLSWLWKPWAEHRIPLAKLTWKSVLQLTGYDFRAGNFLTVTVLAASALAMILAARRMRGRTILADALFPLALLNFGQAQVFLWWWQVNHLFAPVTASLLLLLLILRGNALTMRQAGFIAVGLVFLVLCGPGGLPYVLAFTVWLGYWVAARWRSLTAGERRSCAGVLTIAAIAVGLVGFYFVNYTPYFPANEPTDLIAWAPYPGLRAAATACLQILGLSLGTATKSYAVFWGSAVLVIGAVSTAILISTAFKHPRERERALGLLAFLGAVAVLVVAIARSRAGMGLDYLYQGHYLTLLAPALCCVYFVWEIRGGWLARFVQYGMAVILCALLPFNLRQAVQTGKDLQGKTIAFERDVRNHVAAFVLAERHFASDVVPRTEKLTQIIMAHKKDGFGIFQQIRDDSSYEISILGIETAYLERMVLRDGVLLPSSDSQGQSSLTFSLREPQHIYAIRLRYAYIRTQNAWPTMRVNWRNSRVEDFNENAEGGERTQFSTVAGPDQPTWALIDGKIRTDAKVRTERTLTIWVDGTIDQFRIYPSTAPYAFRLSRIELIH